MSIAREKAAKEADRPGLALDIRRARNRLAQRYARECLPNDYPTFPGALYLKPHVQDPEARAVLADIHDERTALNALATEGCYGQFDTAGINFAYREVGYDDWRNAQPWARVASLWWATDALSRGVDPVEVRRALAAGIADEIEEDRRGAAAPYGVVGFTERGREQDLFGALAIYDTRIINTRWKPWKAK